MSSLEFTPRARLVEDPPLACRVSPEGEVICEGAPSLDAAVTVRANDAKFDATLATIFPEASWGLQKLELALRLLATLAETKFPDDRVARRAGQSVRALEDLLRPTPPSILLFNYSDQPANVMGAWYLNRAELTRMQRVIAEFSHTVEP